jgi:hypothetical protein
MKNIPSKSTITSFAALITLALAANPASAQTWTNSNETYPPGATQNWNIGANWNTGVVPDAAAVNQALGSALINTAVPDITTYIMGNEGTASRNRSLLIDNGGSLNVTSNGTGAFRLFNTAGGHQVTVAAGGSLTVAGTLHNGATTGTGSSSVFNSAGTVSVASLVTGRNAVTNISGGTLAAGSGGITVGSGGPGVVNVTGGAVSSTAGLRVQDSGTLNISGGSLGVTGASGLFIWGTAAAAPRVVHVDGSGASSISLSGLRYFAQVDRDNTTWKFTLDNGADHITPVTLTAVGTSGATLRTGTTLDVGLNGGVLLSGTDKFTLVTRPSGTDTAWGTGPGALWTDTSTSTAISVTLAGAGLGSLDFSNPIALTFANSAYGYVGLTNTNLTQPFTLGLAVSGGTLSNFTTALSSAGIDWSAGTGGYDVNLTMNPAVSGGTVFAWDLQSIDPAMGVVGIAVIPEPSGVLLVGFIGLVLVLRRLRHWQVG